MDGTEHCYCHNASMPTHFETLQIHRYEAAVLLFNVNVFACVSEFCVFSVSCKQKLNFKQHQ